MQAEQQNGLVTGSTVRKYLPHALAAWLHTLYTCHEWNNLVHVYFISCSRPLIGVHMLINLSVNCIAVNDNTRHCSTYQSLSLHTDESSWLMNVSPTGPVVLLVASRMLGGGDPPTTTLLHSYALPLKHISSQFSASQIQGAPGHQCEVSTS